MKTNGKSEEEINHFALSSSAKTNLAFAGIAFTIFIGLLQVQELDAFLIISLICFVVVFPINLLFGFIFEFNVVGDFKVSSTWEKFQRFDKFHDISSIISIIFATIGLTCLILHYSLVVGYIFIGISLISLVLFLIITPKYGQ